MCRNRRADLQQILQADSKLAAVEKLSFWFLNSFWGGTRPQYESESER